MPLVPFAINCLECHDDIAWDEYTASVHGNIACASCHSGITDVEKHSEGEQSPKAPACASCHAAISAEYETSTHRTEYEMGCTDCHSEIHSLQKGNGEKKSVVTMCSSCHDEETYIKFGHGAAVLNGNNDAADCSDCHGLHDARKLHRVTDRLPEDARVFDNGICRQCHADTEMMKRSGLSTDAVTTYDHSYHGKVWNLGYPAKVADCADCHMGHNILPHTDERSAVHESNLTVACAKCHSEVDVSFAGFMSHADHLNKDKSPVLYWTFIAMALLLAGTFLFFWVHTILWWRKAYWERNRMHAITETAAPRTADCDQPGTCYWRFTPISRAMHFLLIVSFFGLVLSGLPLSFNEAPWASMFVKAMGGIQGAGMVHRISAALMIILFTGACLLSLRFLLDKKNGQTFAERLFSPDSLFPRKKDFTDFRMMVKWFFGKGPEPEFDRWTYWEKFDFFAVFWGMTAIGLSGMLLAFPELTSRLLPGWVLNVAVIVHSEEALLALGFIFSVHYFNTHLIPTKFPMDPVIFTGRVWKWQFVAEKPLYYKRLKENGQLKKKETSHPGVAVSLFAATTGILGLLGGLTIFALVLIEFFG